MCLQSKVFVKSRYLTWLIDFIWLLWIQKAHILKYYDWDDIKNRLLKKDRDISFEDIIFEIENGNLLDRIKHPNYKKYPTQYIFIVKKASYVYAVPFVEDDEKIFLKTIIPSRRATEKYLGKKNEKQKN